MFHLTSLTRAYAFESLSFGGSNDKWLVQVTARTVGLWASILSLFKIKSGMTFEVYSDHVLLLAGGRYIIPIQHVSNLESGYQSSTFLFLLMLAAAGTALYQIFHGEVGPFFGWGFLAALFAYLYARSRRFIVEVIGSSGRSIWFSVKRSYVGGTPLPDEDFYRMMDIMQELTADVSGLPRQG